MNDKISDALEPYPLSIQEAFDQMAREHNILKRQAQILGVPVNRLAISRTQAILNTENGTIDPNDDITHKEFST